MMPNSEIDVMIDANIGSYIMSGHPIAERYHADLRGKTIGISFQAMAELRVGQRTRSWNQRAFRSYVDGLIEVPYVDEMQDLFVQIRAISIERQAARVGRKVQAADAWVAAAALWLGVPLVTHNERDFRDIDDLKVISHPDEEEQG